MILLLFVSSEAWAGPTGYIGSDSGITAFDMTTNAVIATLPIAATHGLAITPDGSRLYATSKFDGSVLVLDTASNTVLKSVFVGNWPEQVAITPDGKRAYVSVKDPNGSGSAGEGVAVIDTATNTLVTTIHGPFVGPRSVSVTPDGTRVYVTNQNWVPSAIGAAVTVIDTATNAIIATVPSSSSSPYYAQWIQPDGLYITPDSRRAYVSVREAGYDANLVLEIDTATNTTIRSILVGHAPVGIAGNPDGTRAYVGNVGDGTISVIHRDTTDSAWCCGIPVPYPLAVAVNSDGSRLYATGPMSTSIIDTATETVVATIPVSGAALALPASKKFSFSGFLSPVNNAPTVNTGQAGRTYPVRWRLADNTGAAVGALAVIKSINYQSLSCDTLARDNSLPLDATATGLSSLRYESGANQFVYNWATPNMPGCYQLKLTLTGEQSFTAYFNLK